MALGVRGELVAGRGRPGRWTSLVAFLVAVMVTIVVPGNTEAAQQERPGPSWYTDGWIRDLVRVGDVVYAGGEFSAVTDGNGLTRPRSNLAAFHATTGEVLAWSPRTDGPVMALEVSPDGSHIYVGGDFRHVNDTYRKRLAAVDVAGNLHLDFRADVGGRVLDLVESDGRLVVAGELVSIAGRSRTLLGRVDHRTGALDEQWVPTVDGGSIRGIALSPDHAHLYIGGNFGSVDGLANTAYSARLSMTDGRADRRWRPGLDMPIFDIETAGDDVYLAVGGLGYENNRLQKHSATDGSLEWRYLASGDVQDLELWGDWLYVGGHFTKVFGGLPRSQVAAVDTADGHIVDFAPEVLTLYGVWKILAGPEGLWLGGEFTEIEGETRQGYAHLPADGNPEIDGDRLLARDKPWRYWASGDSPTHNTTAWAQPSYDDAGWSNGVGEIGFGNDDETTAISATDSFYARTTVAVPDPAMYDDIALRLLADAGGAVYINGTEVMRHNLPAGPLTDESLALSGKWTTSEKTWVESHVSPGHLRPGANTIAVEVHGAYDKPSDLSFWFEMIGRRTGQPGPPDPPDPDPDPEVTLIAPGSIWRYRDDGAVAGDGWRQPDFDDQSWSAGAAQLGFGDGDEATTMEPGHNAYWFRRTFTADTPPAEATISLLADDGAVVYINGVEVVRDNLPDGPLNGDSKALGSRWGSAEASLVDHPVDASLVVEGVNTIAVQVHNVWSGNGDLSFDLGLTATGDAGNGGGPGGPITLVAADAWWRYLDNGTQPGPSWPTVGYDDGDWSSGPANFGFGDGDEATVVEPGHHTYFFRERFEVDAIPGTVTLSLAYDDGVIIHVNGHEVERLNVDPAAEVGSQHRALGSRWGADETTPVSIDIDPDLLVVGDNVLAISAHNVWSGNGDLSLDPVLTATR